MKKRYIVHQKMFEFLIYFFNKNKIFYDGACKENVLITMNDLNLEKLQYELILLENYIFQERSALSETGKNKK